MCQLSGVGPSGGDCFADYPDFWGYWHGDGRGGWSWAGSGAASASVGDGDMEGWVWGSGDTASTHQAPPALAFDDVCDDRSTPPTRHPRPVTAVVVGTVMAMDRAAAAKVVPDRTPATVAPADRETTGRRTEATVDLEDQSGAGAVDPRSDGTDDRDAGDRQASPTVAATPSITSATPITALAGGTTGAGGGGGPPAGALLAVIGVAALGAGGWFLRRRQITPAKHTRGD